MTAVKGFIAITDEGWYRHLVGRPGPQEVNFWRPSPKALTRLPAGTPFFFKLRAKHDHAIVGFGFFAAFSILHDWLAWETFEDANGAGSLEELKIRLATIQKHARIEPDPAGRIGCSLIAEARFFAESEWVKGPSNWKPRVQGGEGFDLTSGEGERIWHDCLARANAQGVFPERPVAGERFGAPVLHRPRLGQGIFRVQVLDAYGRGCAVTGEHSLPVLEAAHVKPYSKGGEHEVDNGLLLRTDLHRLFDTGYITVDEQFKLVVGRRLKDDYQNGRSYYALQGKALDLPKAAAARPSREALGWHRDTAFLG